VRMTPIVVIVPDTTLTALAPTHRNLVRIVEETPGTAQMMASHGWTAEMLAWGALLTTLTQITDTAILATQTGADDG
jgi:hypothetical protein